MSRNSLYITPLEVSFNWFVYILGTSPSKSISKENTTILKFNYVMLLKVHCSSFSDITASRID